MVREKKQEEIRLWCNEHGINLINIYQTNRKGKSDIKVTVICNKCGQRYDTLWNTLKRQDFPGLCTYCAHKKSQDWRRIGVDKLVKLFNRYEYKVVTPIDKIKPVGKKQTFSRSVVTIQNQNGDFFNVSWNEFQQNLDKYIELNGNGYEAVGRRKPSRFESKVEDFLIDIGVKYKREFKMSGCRGDKRMLPFDFCIDYDSDNFKLIEVDGERHFRDGFENIKRYDKIKDYYCAEHNIKLLRIPYWEFYSDNYKKIIESFINTNNSNDIV